ncbi:hypothetical protein Q3O60_03995 [Alkalimonas collagenimarina]|uniref:Uncharacterized protein n=1 Tax=Alkalimonas collagenimarina TaxID=400390 RepID=A0ABT9GWF1_9GAMM|nr:hypothetical protein [Alkalimonas collagenimarina]MDP4535348.1 hypothetical protein [Alkalimonas collagenimarina]
MKTRFWLLKKRLWVGVIAWLFWRSDLTFPLIFSGVRLHPSHAR